MDEEPIGAQRATERPLAARPSATSSGVARPLRQRPDPPRADGNAAPSPAHCKILGALRLFEALEVAEPEKANVAVWAGYRPSSGSFSEHLAAMKRAGWVAYPGRRLALTEAGRALVPAPEAPATTEALHAAWLAKLSEPQGTILRALLEIYPEAVSKSDLAERTGYSAGSGSFSSHLAALRQLGAVKYPVPGKAKAGPLLYSETTRR